MNFRLSIVAAAIILGVLGETRTTAQGVGAGFHVAVGAANCPGGSTLSSPTPPASLGPVTLPCTSGQAIVAADAGTGTLRASGRSEHFCCGTASDGTGSARIQIENIVITGPSASSIPVSLNFRLRGTLTGHVGAGQAGVLLYIGLTGFNTSLLSTSQIDMNGAGIYNQSGVFAPLALGFPNATLDQAFVSQTVNAAPNQPLTLEIQLMASSAMSGIGVTEADFFTAANGFAFPPGIPVFNLPPGYTINIPELNIVNNVVGGGGPTPIEFPILVNDLVSLFQVRMDGITGFSVRSRDGSLFRLSGLSRFEPAAGVQPDEHVQEGFVLLDGTLSLELAATREDGTPALTRTTYRLSVPRASLRRETLARELVRQGVVPDVARARTRASAMRLEDARVMRLVETRDGDPARWTRAVRALRTPRPMVFRPGLPPDDVLGHYGTLTSEADGPFVWAVMDRNSRYAVGVTVDRDGDGLPNATDNCIGTANSNQLNTDGDSAGDACDLDDDNDLVPDAGDNCRLAVNADQADFDGDAIGNACDFDDDSDGVLDGEDRCLATAAGSVVDASGCSIADSCPCDSEWRNHGAYVRCVARTSELFVGAGLMTSAQKDALMSASAHSTCGY